MKYSKRIEKIIRHFRYSEIINQKETDEDFLRSYNNFSDKDTLRNSPHIIYATLGGIPNCNHIAAKNLLFKGDDLCWKFFDRTAQFLAYYQNNDYIDNVTSELNYALYVQRNDLIQLLLQKLENYLNSDKYKYDKYYTKQKVYPSSYLIHFLIEKYGIENPIRSRIEKYGSGPGLYRKIIEDWDSDFTLFEAEYWNSLCEYHLMNINGTNRENEEHLFYGLVPIELINIFQLRKKLGLDIPKINHELFHTPMAKFPVLPTGYNQELDVKFQLVKRTVETKRKYTYQEIIDLLKSEHGADADLFY